MTVSSEAVEELDLMLYLKKRGNLNSKTCRKALRVEQHVYFK